MRKNIFLQLSVGCFILCLLLFVIYWRRAPGGSTPRSREQAQSQQAPPKDIVVATQTIPKWTIVMPEMIELQKGDMATQPLPLDAATALDQVQGKITRADISPGHTIAAGELMTKQQFGLSPLLPVGKRAITIAVSDTTAVSGLLRPGDRVDVVCTYAPKEEGISPRARTMFRNVQVAAVGKTLDQTMLNAVEPGNLVTLAVTPKEAEALALVQTRASIHLTLRPLHETQETVEPPSSTTMVFIEPARPKRPVRAASTLRKMAPDSTGYGLAPSPTVIAGFPSPLSTPPTPPQAGSRASIPGPAPVTAPHHTVEVIRGTRHESVAVPVIESKVTHDDPGQDQR